MRERKHCSFKIISCLAAVCVAASSLAGCLAPELAASSSHEVKKELFYAVVRGAQCEIRHAVKQQVEWNENLDEKERVQWLRKWSSLMHFRFSFDTTAAFNPGVSFKTPMVNAHVWLGDHKEYPTSQNYAFGVGGNFSGQSIREEVVQLFYPFDKDFWAFPDTKEESCYHLGGFKISGDLKLADWLDDVLYPIKRCAFFGYPVREPSRTLFFYNTSTSQEDTECKSKDILRQGYSKDNPIRTFSHRITFIITMGAGATPTWNLVRVSSSSLFKIDRKDTFELTVTLGSQDTEKNIAKKEKGDQRHPRTAAQPSDAMVYRDIAVQIGSEVRDALQQ